MYKTSKSPRKVLLTALKVAQDVFPAYSSDFSPKKYTQHQHFAILVLKEFLRSDYRKVQAVLEDCPDLGKAIALEAVPHYTTLQKAAARLLLVPEVRELLSSTLELARKKSSSNSG